MSSEFAVGHPRTSTGAFRNQQSRPNGPIHASRSVPAGARPPLPDDLASFYSNMSSSPRPAEGRRIFPYRPTQVPEVSQYAYANPPPQHHHSFASLYDEAPRNPVRERHPLYMRDTWRPDVREFDSIPHPGSSPYDDRTYGSRPTQDYCTAVDNARHSEAPSMFANPGQYRICLLLQLFHAPLFLIHGILPEVGQPMLRIIMSLRSIK